MILKAYSIRDVHSGFSTPTFEYNDQIAIRAFEHAVQTSASVLKSHKSDFSLYLVGSFDTDTGVVRPRSSSELQLLLDGADVEVSD